MAETGLLKEVDHLSAVSGGGYTASAYASHLAAGDEPLTKENADAWFASRTAALVARMQDNIGYLVTCAHSQYAAPGRKFGSAYPRACDAPAFIALLLFMPVANAATAVAFWILPLVVWINLNHGKNMRNLFCDKGDTRSIFGPGNSDPLWVILACVVGWVLLYAYDKCCGLNEKKSPTYAGWLCHRALKTYASRLGVIAVAYVLVIYATYEMQKYDYGDAEDENKVKCACAKYFGRFNTYDDDDWSYTTDCVGKHTRLSPNRSFALMVLTLVGFIVLGAAFIAIIYSPLIFSLVLRFGGPLVGIFAISYIAEFRVFGPITGQRLLPGGLGYDATGWSIVLFAAYALAICHLPMQHELPRTLHRFYARALRRGYFHDGADVPLEALASSPLCGDVPAPNLILGCTVNEFRRPETDDVAGHMFALTPRGWGGRHTGYARPPEWLTLSRAMALSGAAIDGLVLTNFNSKTLRAVLMGLNLTMGDTLRFSAREDDDDRKRTCGAALSILSKVAEAPTSLVCGSDADEMTEKYRGKVLTADTKLSEHELSATLHLRVREMALFATAYALFAVSAATYSKSDDKHQMYSTDSPIFATIALAIMFASLSLSFFSHAPTIRFLLCSTIVQQMKLVLQVPHFSTRAPPFLTLTDGGLVETIGVVELLRRKCRWCVVVDASEDPGLTCGAMNRILGEAFERHEVVAQAFQDFGGEDLEKVLCPGIAERPYARLWSKYADGSRVDVFLVKMQPPKNKEDACRPLIKPTEITDAAGTPQLLDPETYNTPQLTVREINGLCDDGCHAPCACLPCGEFPFLSVGNQFLTPAQFANLARLGRDVAAPVLEALRAARAEP